MIDQPAIYYRHPAQATNHCLRLPHKDDRVHMSLFGADGIALKMNGLKRGWFPVVSWEVVALHLEQALRSSPALLADVKAMVARIEGGP